MPEVKNPYPKFGRSPAMDGLSLIREFMKLSPDNQAKARANFVKLRLVNTPHKQ